MAEVEPIRPTRDDEPYVVYLVRWLGMEKVGQIVTRILAEVARDAREAEAWRCLNRLEALMSDQLVIALDGFKIEVLDPAGLQETARAIVVSLTGLAWQDMMVALAAEIAPFAEELAAREQDCPLRWREHVARLARHEEAWLAFAKAEAAGAPAGSLDQVNAILEAAGG